MVGMYVVKEQASLWMLGQGFEESEKPQRKLVQAEKVVEDAQEDTVECYNLEDLDSFQSLVLSNPAH